MIRGGPGANATRAVPALLCLALATALVAAAPQSPVVPPAQSPLFRSSVDLVAVDVQVVDRDGKPLPGLGAPDFDVTIDGRTRAVVSVDLVRYGDVAAKATVTAATADASAPITITTPDGAAARVFVIAVDESSFTPAGLHAATDAAKHFVANLQPDDVAGLYAFPYSNRRLELKHDHASVSRALGGLTGRRDSLRTEFHLTTTETMDIAGGDASALDDVLNRECDGSNPDPMAKALYNSCRTRIVTEANVNLSYLEATASFSLDGLRELVRGLAGLPGRKTLLVLSGGLTASDRSVGPAGMASLTTAIGEEASVSHTNMYVMHIDSGFLDAFSAANSRQTGMGTYTPFAGGATEGAPQTHPTTGRDSEMLARGLERIASNAGGAFLRVQAGTGDYAFDRVLRETSAYYMLGVTPIDADRNGQLHKIGVKVKAKGAAVQHRTSVFIPKVVR